MNFKHLHYFWATAKAGGIMRAGEQLHITPQTLSGQIKLLEERLGCTLFRKSGRRLELTEEGRTALAYADQIFSLGAEMETAIAHARAGGQVLDFRVGLADSVPKAIVLGRPVSKSVSLSSAQALQFVFARRRERRAARKAAARQSVLVDRPT
jgi:DNA-binding transcriptional LysR family regulator